MRTGHPWPVSRSSRRWRGATRWIVLTLGLLVAALSLAMRRERRGSAYWERFYSTRRYFDPVALQISPRGRRLYVACEGRNEVLEVDTHTRRVMGELAVGRHPKGLALSPGGRWLYVANNWSNSVSVIDTRAWRVTRTLPVGWGPEGLATDHTGRYLYTANTLGNDISVVQLATGREIRRLSAGHFPAFAARLRGGLIAVSDLLAQPGSPEQPPVDQLSLVDTATRQVARRILVPGAIQMRQIAQASTRHGDYLLIPFLQPHNLVPLIVLRRDWYAANGLAIVEMHGHARPRVREVLLDGLNRAYANGYGAVVAPHTPWALITASGVDRVSILDLNRLLRLLRSPAAADLSRNLADAARFIVRRLPTGHDPTAVVASADGHYAYIANRTDDTISVINLHGLRSDGLIRLGGRHTVTEVRRGQQLFFDADHAHERELACATCHPDEGFEDGLMWSFEVPHLGQDIVVNKTLRAIRGTGPFKWNGLNPNLATQDGPRTATYIFRSQGFSPRQVRDLVSFVNSLRLPPNPYRAPDGRLTAAQARGRAIFFRSHTNTGAIIPVDDRCYRCHAPLTHYTSRVLMNVGTATRFDNTKAFKVPSLEGIYMRPPYLHNGEAQSLEEIWTKFNPHNRHGFTSDMNKEQLNDLIQFLKSL
ncbi:MAG: hypothetical protein M1588_04735 [Planctomycetes bacterium]|nr:hypothetical protein [Planctomycetota bacterium]